MVFTPIHRALDLEPSDLTFELLDQAVAAHVREADDLDWKLTLPQRSENPKWKEEFAKDVAAMANSGGGWLVYGVSEDRKTSAATEVAGVGDLDQGVEQQLRGVAHGHIRPAVRELRFHPISDPDRGNVLMLHVPASLDVPHLLSPTPQSLGAPRRFGAQSEWMGERELEQAYRSRFTAQADRARLLRELLDAQLRRLSPALGSVSAPHVVMVGAAVPLEPRGAREMSLDDAAQVFDDGQRVADALVLQSNGPWHGPLPRRGMRRYTQDMEDGSTCSVHVDGAVTVARRLWRPGQGLAQYSGPVVPGTELEAAVAQLTGLIAATGRNLAISGPHLVLVTVFWRPEGPLRFALQDPHMPDACVLVEPPVVLNEVEVVDAEVHGDGSIDELRSAARGIALDVLHQGGIIRTRYLR